MELRCILEQGKVIKHIMTSAMILLIVEGAICFKCIVRYWFR